MTDARRHLIAGIILLVVVGAAAALYLSAGLNAGGGQPIMPLDDAYIHFEYARAFAEGHPFRYNADQPPTSGGTSLLYPPLLAMGYLIGFQGERLAWWALLIGALAWFGSTWLVYRIGAGLGAPPWVAVILAAAFALQGSLSWAFMSGMETGLMIFLTLLTLRGIIAKDRRGALIAAILVTLLRPEGIVIGGLALLYIATGVKSRRSLLRHSPIIALPFVAALVQPILNLLLTGSITASGMQAKSYLYNVPFDPGFIVNKIAATALDIWGQMYGDLTYFTKGLILIAAVGAIWGAVSAIRRRQWNVTVLILGWLLGLTLIVATLDTAFWQFKRYQQPMIALLFPLVAWLTVTLLRRGTLEMYTVVGCLAILGGSALQSFPAFAGYYADNVREVASSQVPMARYVTESLPPGAIVGVHDIGVMRYLGTHTTYDVVGLTTPGEAKVWRQGPGAVFEQMAHSPWRPAYFAIYPDALGLSYLADTGLFREKLAAFPSTKPPYNVASATASGQNVYRADWTFAAFADKPLQPSSQQAIAGLERVDSVNVGYLADEEAHTYRWWEAAKRPGFATEVYEMDYIACASPADNPACKVLDGGRLITGGEEMTIATHPGQDLIWVTRVHPRNVATLGIFVNGQRVGTRVIPAVPGRWLEIVSLVPGHLITGERTVVRVDATITDPTVGHYMPYYHWFYQGIYHPDNTVTLPGPTATFGQSIQLAGRQLTYDAAARQVTLNVEWQLTGAAPLDAKLFLHLYDTDGKLREDAQLDRRPGDGALPPANWLPGTLRETYTLDVPGSVPPGSYRVAVGLYDPVTGARLPVSGEGADQERRLFIGDVQVR